MYVYCIFFNNTIIVQVRYIIIETNEFSHIGYNRILFPHSYSGDSLGAMHLGLHLSTHAEKETHYIQYGPLLLFQWYCILYLPVSFVQTLLSTGKVPPVS